MIRTQVQFDDAAYHMLKQKAHERGMSMSALLRELVQQAFLEPRKKLRFEDFTFIGSGSRDDGEFSPVSERHDEVLAYELLKEIEEKRQELEKGRGK